jgi:hypothetical protein
VNEAFASCSFLGIIEWLQIMDMSVA